MNTGLVTNRYAKALWAFAEKRGVTERVHNDVIALRQAMTDELARQGDDGILTDCVTKLSPEMQQFLRIVVANGRADHLPSMLRQFIVHYNRQKGVATASLSAAAPSPTLENKLMDLLHDKGYSQVDFTTTVNPELIGGFILQIEDQRLDASLSSQLRELTQAFVEKNKRII